MLYFSSVFNRSLLLLFVLIASLAVIGCSSGNTASSSTPTTTVLVYIIGSDLEESPANAATNNIIEMESVGSTANMNVVIQTGGTNKPGWRIPTRQLVLQGSIQLLESLPAGTDMGAESTLQNFIQWGVSNYPAQKYILVMWDHGGGPNAGFGPDALTNHIISLPQIVQAISTVSGENNIQFEITGFDACLMGTAEIGAGLASSTNYMVASEDLVPSTSWSYTPFLQYVTDNPTANGAQVGEVIVNGYVQKSASSSAVTLSVVNLSQMQNIINATNQFATDLLPFTTESQAWQSIALARIYSLDYYTASFFGMTTDLVDFNQFVNNVASFINSPLITSDAQAIVTAVNNAVVYESSTYSDYTSTGLSIYFPSVLAAYPSKNYASNTTYNNSPFFAVKYTESSANSLIQSYYNYYYAESSQLIASWVNPPINNAGIITESINNNFMFVLVANGKSNCSLYNSGSFSTDTCYNNIKQVESIESSTPNQQIVSFNKNSESWPFLYGQPVILIPDSTSLKVAYYSQYMVPAYESENGSPANKMGYLVLEESKGIYQVQGFQGIGSSPGKTMQIDVGDSYYLAAYSNGEWYPSSNLITIESGPVMITFAPATGSQFAYIVNDLTGAINTSESVAY